jgi:hypothetical protein
MALPLPARGDRTALPRELPWPYESFDRREPRLGIEGPQGWRLSPGGIANDDRDTHVLYIIDVIRGRFSPGEREQRILSTARVDGTSCDIRIPQDPGGAGKFEAHHLAGLLQGYRVSSEREEGSKENRADPATMPAH